PLPQDDDMTEIFNPFTLNEKGLLLYSGLVYIPMVDILKLNIFKNCHNVKTVNHLSQKKTLKLVSQNYYWLRMRAFVNEYIRTYNTCARNKASHHTPYKYLQPFPIPSNPWK